MIDRNTHTLIHPLGPRLEPEDQGRYRLLACAPGRDVEEARCRDHVCLLRAVVDFIPVVFLQRRNRYANDVGDRRLWDAVCDHHLDLPTCVRRGQVHGSPSPAHVIELRGQGGWWLDLDLSVCHWLRVVAHGWERVINQGNAESFAFHTGSVYLGVVRMSWRSAMMHSLSLVACRTFRRPR